VLVLLALLLLFIMAVARLLITFSWDDRVDCEDESLDDEEADVDDTLANEILLLDISLASLLLNSAGVDDCCSRISLFLVDDFFNSLLVVGADDDEDDAPNAVGWGLRFNEELVAWCLWWWWWWWWAVELLLLLLLPIMVESLVVRSGMDDMKLSWLNSWSTLLLLWFCLCNLSMIFAMAEAALRFELSDTDLTILEGVLVKEHTLGLADWLTAAADEPVPVCLPLPLSSRSLFWELLELIDDIVSSMFNKLDVL
jgi:hypothetical protein